MKRLVERILLIVVAFAISIGMSGCGKIVSEPITSVESMEIEIFSMEGCQKYEFVNENGKGELRYYNDYTTNTRPNYQLESSVECDPDEFAELMNTCKVPKWDGFHGKHPQDVMDGASFGFTANVNNGKTIEASGSANYPKGYGDLIYAMKNMLKDSENK